MATYKITISKADESDDVFETYVILAMRNTGPVQRR